MALPAHRSGATRSFANQMYGSFALPVPENRTFPEVPKFYTTEFFVLPFLPFYFATIQTPPYSYVQNQLPLWYLYFF
jgi:hypothetical protein